MRVLLLIPVLLVLNCTAVKVSRETYEVSQAASINPQNRYLKVHMQDGSVYVLNDWFISSSESEVVGKGSYLDHNRRPIETSINGPFKIPFSDVALFETNDTGNSINHGLVLVSAITLGFTINCIINPKSCFGSCPTFYANGPDGQELMAEGFSRSISPQLEESDMDMLYNYVPQNNRAPEITVTNEALETHYIRSIELAAVQKQGAERVFKDAKNQFWRVSQLRGATSSSLQQEDVLEKLQAFDSKEWFDQSDSTNLAAKVELEFSFTSSDLDEKQGLIISKRQSLLTTYLFYQTLSYMGRSAAHWLTEMERGNFNYDYDGKGIYRELGGIEIFVKDDMGNWEEVDRLNEAGPIATDTDVVPLPPTSGSKVNVKLRMTKGMWRINYLALGSLEGKTQPEILPIEAVFDEQGEQQEDVLAQLLDGDDLLITMPGDEYKLVFAKPGNSGSYEYFLNSTGYYLEWMREEWVKEQDLKKLWQAFHRPKRYLKKEAATYKGMEASMEQVFWNSRYVKK